MFSEYNMYCIMVFYILYNKCSENVFKCVGFVFEGYVKDYLLINGKWEDYNLILLINFNWKE